MAVECEYCGEPAGKAAKFTEKNDGTRVLVIVHVRCEPMYLAQNKRRKKDG